LGDLDRLTAPTRSNWSKRSKLLGRNKKNPENTRSKYNKRNPTGPSSRSTWTGWTTLTGLDHFLHPTGYPSRLHLDVSAPLFRQTNFAGSIGTDFRPTTVKQITAFAPYLSLAISYPVPTVTIRRHVSSEDIVDATLSGMLAFQCPTKFDHRGVILCQYKTFV
jgi:hypothetical protein